MSVCVLKVSYMNHYISCPVLYITILSNAQQLFLTRKCKCLRMHGC